MYVLFVVAAGFFYVVIRSCLFSSSFISCCRRHCFRVLRVFLVLPATGVRTTPDGAFGALRLPVRRCWKLWLARTHAVLDIVSKVSIYRSIVLFLVLDIVQKVSLYRNIELPICRIASLVRVLLSYRKFRYIEI